MKVRPERFFLLFLVSACAAIPYSAHAADTNGYLYIAHAAPGRNISSTTNPEYPVDISIGGQCIAQGLSFGEIRGPFTLPAATYAAKLSIADATDPCGGSVVFSGSAAITAGSSWMGMVALNSANQVVGKIFALDLKAVPTGRGILIVANTTTDNLTGTITVGDGTSSPLSANFAAGTVTSVPVLKGLYNATVYPEGSSTAATGPTRFESVSRNVYLFVLAGSTANNSVQIIGPEVIRDVL